MHTTRDHMNDKPTTAQIQGLFHTEDLVQQCVGVLRHWRHEDSKGRPTMRGMDGPEGYFYWRITLVRLMPNGMSKRYRVTCTGHAFGNCRYGKAIQDDLLDYSTMAKSKRATDEERLDRPNLHLIWSN